MTGFRILGPVEVWNGERRLELGGPRQITLLALFLLHANRALSLDSLIDIVWGEARASGDNRLRMAIARLRKTLAPLQHTDEPLLQTVASGYLLRVGPGELDADVFRALVSQGHAALETGDAVGASEHLRAAVGLWRGPPLAEVTFEDFAQAEIRRLAELRLTALESRIEADLQLGRHSRLVAELEGLLVEQPTRERFAAQLMLALYRCGRQAEALEAYQRIRASLGNDLGLEPGPAIRTLQAEILEQAASLQPEGAGHVAHIAQPITPRVSAPFPSLLRPQGPSVFVDREEERRALFRALRESTASGRRAAFVAGDPGIGKTRLVSEVAAEAHEAGAVVLASRCDNALDLPYQPFVDALEHLVEHAPQELLARHVAEYGDSIARLVPALAARVESPVDSRAVSESERYVLFRAIEGLLTAAATRGPLLLVLEDLQWVDAASLTLLRRLLTSPKSPPFLLLATCQLAELEGDHPLRDLLADLRRESDVLRIELTGLGGADVLALVSSLWGDRVGHDVSDIARTLAASTDGNPFFITELVRGLEPDRVERLPASIAETLGRRVQRMGDGVRRCLGLASALGDEFDLDLITELADDDVEAAVGEAERAGILIEAPEAPLRFRFAHALMQRYLYQQLGAVQRMTLHRRIGIALEPRLADGRVSAAEVARHRLAAGRAASPDAIRLSILAGDEALRKLGPDDARRWYQIALDLTEQQPEARESERCELLIRRGEAERYAGDRRFRESLLDAAEIAQRIGDGARLVRAALANTRGMQSETGVVDAARIGALDAALRVAGETDSATRAQLLAMRAAELMYSQDWPRRVRMSDEALAMARRIDDPAALSAVLNMRFVTLLAPKTLAERSKNTIEATEVSERLGDPLVQFFAYHWRSYACIETGDMVGARTWATREREIAERFRQPTTLWLSCADQANLAIVAGDLDRADRMAGTALEIGGDSEPDALACYAAQQASIAFYAGRLGDLVPRLEQAVKANPGVPGFRAVLALAQADSGCHAEAHELLSEAAAAGFAGVPYDVAWLAVLCIYAHVCAELEDVATAVRLYELLSPWREQIAFPAFGVWGPVDLYLGALARTRGDFDAAEQHLLAASQAAGRAAAPRWQQRALSQLARLAAAAT